jgi:hypothetical protein
MASAAGLLGKAPQPMPSLTGGKVLAPKFRTKELVNEGVTFLAGLFGFLGENVLESYGVLHTPDLILAGIAGWLIGCLIGWLVCRVRPRCDRATGAWAAINHFCLTQMDFNSAFKRQWQWMGRLIDTAKAQRPEGAKTRGK